MYSQTNFKDKQEETFALPCLVSQSKHDIRLSLSSMTLLSPPVNGPVNSQHAGLCLVHFTASVPPRAYDGNKNVFINSVIETDVQFLEGVDPL